MPSTEKIIDDLTSRSDKIGEITRAISLSVLALVWLFVAGGSDGPSLPHTPNQTYLYLTAALCLASLLFDYFQLVSGYLCSKSVLRLAESVPERAAKYNTRSFLYRARAFFFWLKQAFAVAALGALFGTVISAL